MRPIRLEIENLRSFRAPQTIDFTDLRLCAIIGDTGAGKTSILEAITYALFNRPTFSGRDVKELIADGAKAMRVVFTFAVQDDEFTVWRQTKRVGASTHRLSCPKRGIDLAGESEVRHAIKETLRLDDDAFLRTVILPQGRYAELLVSRDAERRKILNELFGLNQLTEMHRLTKEAETTAVAEFGALDRERKRLPDDPRAELADAQAAYENAVRAGERVREARTTADALIGEIKAGEAEIDRAASARTQVQEGIALVVRLRELEERGGTLQAALRKQEERLHAAREERQAVDAERERLEHDAATLQQAVRTLDAIVRELRELEKHERERAEIDEDLQRILAEGKAANARESAAREALAAARTRRDAIEQRLVPAQQAEKALAQGFERCDEARRAVERDERELAQVRAQGEAAERERATAETALTQAREQAKRARAVLERAQVANQAAAIAQHLHAGEACPVCARELPSDFSAPANADLDAASKQDKDAIKRVEACQTAFNRADVQLQTLRRSIADGERRLADARRQLEALDAALAALLPEPDAERALRAMREALAADQRELPALRAEIERTQQAHGEVERQLAELRGRHTQQNKRRQALVAEDETRRRGIEESVGSLPGAIAQAYRVEGTEAARALTNKHLGTAERLRERGNAADREIAAASDELQKQQRRYDQEIAGPRLRLTEQLDTIASLLDYAPCSARGSSDEERDARRAWADGLSAAATAFLATSDERIAGLREEHRRRSAALGEALQAAGATSVQELETVTLRAELAKQKAQSAVTQSASAVELADDLAMRIERLHGVRVGLQTLKDLLGAAEFVKYVLQRRQRRLIEVGSLILQQMTGQRYAFTEEFQIFDGESNAERMPHTLSGGEQFVASLALSLAVVEIAAGSGAHIGSLFLDEGFGTLDSETLQTAMLELRRHARSGRTIGVITHLSSVTEYVSHVLRVRKTIDGSTVHAAEEMIEEENENVAEGLVSQLLTIS